MSAEDEKAILRRIRLDKDMAKYRPQPPAPMTVEKAREIILAAVRDEEVYGRRYQIREANESSVLTELREVCRQRRARKGLAF